MSAGELEHEVAGTPGSLIRERYRKAALLMKNTVRRLVMGAAPVRSPGGSLMLRPLPWAAGEAQLPDDQ